VTGRLVLVATPIGNLGDLSPRAVEALAGADTIACEDTRVARRLLSAAGVAAPRLIALHAHNENEAARGLVDRVAAGEVVALVTDAGMPGISDPGSVVVAEAAARGVEVVVVPGPSAALAALAVSGMPTDRFVFEGFLPRKGGDRTRRLEALAVEERTTVLFESPRRVAATLADIATHCGAGRTVAVARELTKLHEEVWRGTAADAAARAVESEPRGEHVIVVSGATEPDPASDADIRAELERLMSLGADRKSAVAEVARSLRVPRRRVYDLSLGR
jgi:16S rRNA (cytidine1402-2'-O)-methyltransferase